MAQAAHYQTIAGTQHRTTAQGIHRFSGAERQPVAPSAPTEPLDITRYRGGASDFRRRVATLAQKQRSTRPAPMNGQPTRLQASVDACAFALLLIDTDNRLQGISTAAAALLGVSAQTARGQMIDGVVGSTLAALVIHPVRTRFLRLGDGRTLLVIVKQASSTGGRFVLLQDVTAALAEFLPPQQTAQAGQTLQQQLGSLRELVGMLPNFAQHQYWRELLAEHMQQLVAEMSQQVQQLV